MIKRIIIENYMSHSRTVIEPAEGLTILLGENNCGKSAVVSALRSRSAETGLLEASLDWRALWCM